MNTGGTPPKGRVSPRHLADTARNEAYKRWSAWGARKKRQARDRQAEIVRIIAKSHEMFGRAPTNKQLAEMIGVSAPTISKYRKEIKERLATEPCPLCGTKMDGPKI